MIMLKLFFSKALDILTRYPLQIILVLVCVYAFWQKTRYEAVNSDYEAYKVSVQLQADMQKAKNEILKKQAVAEVTNIVANHTQQLEVEKLDRKRVEANLKGAINEISNELNIYRSAIGVRNSATNSIDVSKVADYTNGTPEAIGNCNQTLAAVVDACKVTDYDYEALYNLYQKQCDIFGCE